MRPRAKTQTLELIKYACMSTMPNGKSKSSHLITNDKKEKIQLSMPTSEVCCQCETKCTISDVFVEYETGRMSERRKSAMNSYKK